MTRGSDGRGPADGTCVRRGCSQHCSQLQDRLPGPPTHDLKAGLHHLSHREAYGATWSSLGSSLAKSTFGRPARGALRSGRGTVFTRLWSCEKRVHLHLLEKLKCPWASASPKEQLYTGCIQCRSSEFRGIPIVVKLPHPRTHVPSAAGARRAPEMRCRAGIVVPRRPPSSTPRYTSVYDQP